MRNLIYLCCMAAVMFGCSKESLDVIPKEPPIEPITPEDKLDKLTQSILNATSDTVGLKIFGQGTAIMEKDAMVCILGTKHEKMWCGFYEYDGVYTEKFTYISKDDFKDTIKFDIGYGEEIEVYFPNEGKLYMPVRCIMFDASQFALCAYKEHGGGATIFVNGDSVSYKYFFPTDIWIDGYYSTGSAVYDTHGEYVFDIKSDGTPISLYKCVCFSKYDEYISIELEDARTGDMLWENKVYAGKTMGSNAPKLSYTYSLDSKIITVDITAVNYDGSKENKVVSIDLENGEIVENSNI